MVRSLRNNVLIIYFVIILFFIFLYSYTQVDLNLTLLTNKNYLDIQKIFTNIGYFNRQLSVKLYIFILFNLSICYICFLYLSYKSKITLKKITFLIVFSGVFLLFSYPAFSYDIFNYMFDARIISKYGLNPYMYKALDFPLDPWIRFMRWTHRVYPYGPVWIATTLPFSYLGFQKFILTLILFKSYFLGLYFGSCYLIYKILTKIKIQKVEFAVTFFALNPLIIIETVLSPHNDSLTLFLILLSLYFLISKDKWKSLFSLFFSGLVKYVSLVLIPIYGYLKFKKIGEWDLWFKYFFLAYLIGVILLSLYRELLPWYFIPLVGLSALTYKSLFYKYITAVASIILMFKYAPFLYKGEWKLADYNIFIISTLIILFISTGLYFLKFKSIIK